MTADDTDSISRALGRVEGLVQSLMDQWGRQEANASQLRQKNNDKLEQLERSIDRLATDLMNVQQDVAELKNDVEPAIKAFEAEHNRKLGAKGVWALLGAAFVGVGTLLYHVADRLIDYIRHP